MKRLSTLFTTLMLLVCGAMVVQAQSKIPGELDLSTTVVDAGSGTLHDPAGWDGSKIDWMTKGNTATIQFENTQANTKYNIISYGGTNQSQVVINFQITAADGSVFYDATTEPYTVGGFGDKKPNKSLPTTNPMPAGNYTLVMTYDNLEEGQSLTVNITKIEFLDSEAQEEDPNENKLGLTIPGVLDGSKATFEKNCSWGSSPSCDESNCFNWVGDGDVISFPITNTKTSAYAISFDTATPCEPVTIDFLITDANGTTVYGQTANVVCTGVDGGDWAFKPEGHNTSLPNTDVLPAGNYTLKLTFHQGTNYENFTTNVKDITFTEAGGSGDSFDIDLSTVDTSESQGNKTLHYMGDGDENCPRLDYPSAGDVAKFKINISKEAAYKMSINYATPMDGMFMTWIITNASGNEVYNQMFNLDPTGAPGDFWTIYKDFDNIPQTPVLPAGEYTLTMKYNIDQNGNIVPGSYNGDVNANFHVNIKRITFTAVANDTPVDATVFSWEGSATGAIVKGGKATFEGGDEGENRVNYANTSAAGTTYYTLSLNGNKANINDEGYEKNKTPRIVISLDNALEANDEIAVTAYSNKGDDTKISTPYFLFSNGTELFDDSKTYIDLGYDTNTEPSTQTYVVPEAAAGCTSFKLTRSMTGTNLFITKLVITRGGESSIRDMEVTTVRKYGNAIYNLAGQKVDDSYKGIVIKNGRKYIQK